MMLLLLALACSDPPPAAPPPAPQAADHGAGGHGAAGHGADGHSHGAPHGGMVQTVGSIHLEVRLLPEGVMAWVTDAQEKELDPAPYAGTATVQGPAGVQTVPLNPMGTHLHAMARLEHGQPATVVLTIPVDGQMKSVSYSVEKVGLDAHEHTPLHGGVVGMVGPYHIEYVFQDGQQRFYMSDDKRVAVVDEVSGQIEQGGQLVPLTFDPAQGLLQAPATVPQGQPVKLKATVRGASVELGFPLAAH